MNEQRINEDWLFKINSRDEISKWVSNLKYSYLWKRPSFRDDGDYISLTLNFTDKDDLLEILKIFGIGLKKIPVDFPKPIPGKSYSWTEFEKFKNEIKDFPEYEQPGQCKIGNAQASVWVENKKISFTFSGSCRDYEVCEKDYENCLKIETIITNQNLIQKVNRDIESNIGCITERKYPELYQNGNTRNKTTLWNNW
jgi:hypothetical protein